MSAVVSPSEIDRRRDLSQIRARGLIDITLAHDGRRTHLAALTEAGGYRCRLPTPHNGCEAVIVNTGGGLVGGDHLHIRARALPAAQAAITTTSAERVYRALDAPTEVAISLNVEAGADLIWAPNETIMFSGARLARTVTAAVASNASVLLCEAIVFGRTASGERITHGSLADRWRIHRDGRLVFADDVRLTGRITDALAAPAVGAGAIAFALVVLVSPDAADLRERTQAAALSCQSIAGASAWNGVLSARLAAPRSDMLRNDLARLIAAIRPGRTPCTWPDSHETDPA